MLPLSILLSSLGAVSAFTTGRRDDATAATTESFNPDFVTATPGPAAPQKFGAAPAPSPNAYISYQYPAPKCTSARVRKEWRSLTKAQQTKWVGSVKCLNKLPHFKNLQLNGKSAGAPVLNTSSSIYDDFSLVHMDLASQVHLTGFFLTWHRWYIDNYDRALRTKCGYDGPTPYWDWSIDAPAFAKGSIFNVDSASGLGSWGNPSKDYVVDTGAFANFPVSYPYAHKLRRQLTLQPFNFPFFPADVQKEIANSTFTTFEMNKLVKGFTGSFKFFQGYFEKLWGGHGSVHGILGGDLAGVCSTSAPTGVCTSNQFSPNEPLFWLHHANVDRLWFAYQNYNKKSNFWAFEGGSIMSPDIFNPNNTNPNGIAPWLSLTSRMPTNNFLAEARIADIMDTMGGTLCYTYDNTRFG